MAEVGKLFQFGIVLPYLKGNPDTGCSTGSKILDLQCDHGGEIPPAAVRGTVFLLPS